jgi:hypothetical protein
MKFHSAIVSGLACLLLTGCTVSPPRQRGYEAEVSIEEAGVRLLRNGMTVCLIRTQFSKVEDWQLINGNTEIVIKSRSQRGPVAIELFDTRTGILKGKVMAGQAERPSWAEGLWEESSASSR